jgi:tetratricopeptide (TPR) repeat protein
MRLLAAAALLPLLAYADDALTNGLKAFEAGHYQDARKLFEASTDANAPALRALAQAATGNCNGALPSLASQFQSAGDATIRKLAGEALLSCVETQLQGDYPADADVLYEAAHAHMKGWNDAIYQMFQKTPASYRVNQISGEILEMQGKYSEAAAEYRKAIAKNPKAVNLHFRLGRVLLIDSQSPDTLEAARREFEAELALNAEDAAAEYEVGQILIAQGKADQGNARMERALALRPDFAEALVAVAKARMQAKRYPEAVELLQRAIKQQPRNESAHYTLMMAYRNSGDLAAAAREKKTLDALQKPPEGEFTDFLKKLGEKPPQP